MKSFTGKFTSARGWVLMIALFFGAGLMISACGDEEVPAPTTPAPPPPEPEPEPEPTPEPPTTPVGLMVSGSTESSITWTWNAVEGATGYVVQASTDEMFDDMVLGNPETVLFNGVPFTPMTSYTATDLDAETSLYVRVAAAAGTVDAPLVSAFSTHVTGMATAAASAAPAAPMNVRATAQRSTYIEWSWDAVSGAAGYHAQFSRSTDFSDPAADRPLLQRTSVRISNLPAETDGYLRVRAYTGSGTGEDTVFGDWSATSMSSTGEPPPPPAPTALDAPGNVQTSIAQNSITVTWGAVDDAVEYAVEQQRAAGGSWGDASCGTGGTVTATSCVASGLDQATAYNFRVKAFPDSSDTTLTESSWSSAVSATTSGVAPPPPITGGDDKLNVTWESKADSITWFWEAASDNRFGYVTAVLTNEQANADPRPGCPALTTAAAWSEVGYANRYPLGSLSAGQESGLCVRRTWVDAQDSQQYGPASLVWAATSPAEGTAPEGGVPSGLKPATGTKTNAIDWYVAMDSGFDYNVQVVSKTYDGMENLDCADASGTVTKLTSERYRLANPSTYTTYAACVTAGNEQGSSSPSLLMVYHTQPKEPTFGSIILPKYNRGKVANQPTPGAWSGNIVWSFGGEPEPSTQYDIAIIRSETDPSPPTQTECTAAIRTRTTPLIAATGETGNRAFKVELAHDDAFISLQPAEDGATDVKTYIQTCVRAKLSGAQSSSVGPWKVDAKRTFTATKHLP